MADLFAAPVRRWLPQLMLLLTLLAAERAAALDRYQVEGYQLANGLQVLLKPGYDRGHVAIRLVVGVGFDDFSCADQELPHLLEHLLFSGLDGTGEGGLEERMQALGGEWNAFTSSSDTTFVIEAPARNQRKVLDLLRDILVKTRIDAQALALSQRIVEHEDGGHDSHLQRLLDHQDDGPGAVDSLASELGLKCAKPASVAGLTLKQVEKVRRTWYAANNMSLIVVGDLDRLLPAYIERVYGALPAVEPVDSQQPLLSVSHAAAATRTLSSDWIGDDAKLHWFFLEPPLDNPQTLDLVRGYLDWALYTELRLEHGLSYGPWSERDAFGDTGILSLNADLRRADVDQANRLLESLVQRLRADGLNPATFERLKQQAVAKLAWTAQGNTSLANYYWNNLGDDDSGRFADPAQSLRKITLEQANQALAQLLAKPAYRRVEQPLFGADSLLAVAATLLVLLLGVFIGLVGYWRRSRQR